MANEIVGVSASGTLYARLMNGAGKIWNGTTFETYAAGNWANYDIAMTEQGNSGVYVADFPSAISAAGTYQFFVHKQIAGAPAEGDPVIITGKVDWLGSASAASIAGAMTGSDYRDYLVRRGFKRTDKDTEIYEAITDAIQAIRRRFSFDEAMADQETTDVIASLGDFRVNVESDFGLLLGVVLEDGTNAKPLIKKSKAQFDEIYPDIHVSSDRGYPEHFCVFNGQIYIGPIPDSTSYAYRKSYSKRAGTVSSATSAVPFTSLYRDMLTYLVFSFLYDGLEEYEKAQYYRQLFEDEWTPAVRRERVNSGQSTFTMGQADC